MIVSVSACRIVGMSVLMYACLCAFLLVCMSVCMYAPLLHSAQLSTAFNTDPPTHSRWLKLCHSTEFHFPLDMVAERSQVLLRVEPVGSSRDSAAAAASAASREEGW